MERIVMAVSAGHDILSAIRTTLELQTTESEELGTRVDPVSRLLDVVFRLTEAGVPFDEALKEVASKVECPPLRHSFMHLGRAYKDGGEVVMPLKELSDSTQLFYQETVDERIAKMPVKATLPLLCTFFGLIVCFVTIPVLQVVTVTLKARQSAGLE
jgi:type II secretory pathway component PulF